MKSIGMASVGGKNFQEVCDLVHSWFPRAETLIPTNTTHMLHMMNPELVAKGLRDFFSLALVI